MLNFILPIQIDSTLQATYIGIAVFLILVWLADFPQMDSFQKDLRVDLQVLICYFYCASHHNFFGYSEI